MLCSPEPSRTATSSLCTTSSSKGEKLTALRRRAAEAPATKTEEKDEEQPRSRRAGRRGSGSRERTPSSSSGWGAYDDKRRNTSSFNEKFSVNDGDEHLIKFLDAEPIVVYLQHWVDEVPKGTRKSYVCQESFDLDCPLCALGFKPTTQTLFNVLDLGKPEGKKSKPEVKVWHITSVTVSDQIKKLSEARRNQPINREDLYWAVSPEKKNRKTTWTIDPIKAEDIGEAGWDIEPFTQKELDTWAEDGITELKEFAQVDTVESLEELIEEHDLDS